MIVINIFLSHIIHLTDYVLIFFATIFVGACLYKLIVDVSKSKETGKWNIRQFILLTTIFFIISLFGARYVGEGHRFSLARDPLTWEETISNIPKYIIQSVFIIAISLFILKPLLRSKKKDKEKEKDQA